MKNVEFNGAAGTDYAPITEDDAMRRPDSNYNRTINIEIEPAYVEGYVYDDIDGKSGYNESSDTALENVGLFFFEIEEFDETQVARGVLQPKTVKDIPQQVTTDENGYYNISGMLPSYYALNVYEDDFLIYQEITPLRPGDTSINISKKIKSSVSGITYYDEDEDGEYSLGDKIIDGAQVELQYISYKYGSPTLVPVQNITSGSDGSYSFTDIIPGNYVIEAIKSNEYQTTEQLEVLENESQTFNISMMLAPVEVSGVAKYTDIPVQNSIITFEPDGSIEGKNTAVANEATTDADGLYTVELQPGSYNISVKKEEESTLIFNLDPEEKLSIDLGDEPITRDFTLTKNSVTIAGVTSYEGTRIDNVSVRFTIDTWVENNSAQQRTIQSDEFGQYLVELSPGTYNIRVDHEVNESGVIKTYSYSENQFIVFEALDQEKPIELVLKEES
jgi:hypothetical protein